MYLSNKNISAPKVNYKRTVIFGNSLLQTFGSYSNMQESLLPQRKTPTAYGGLALPLFTAFGISQNRFEFSSS